MNSKILLYILGLATSLIGGFFPEIISTVAYFERYEFIPQAIGEGFFYFSAMFGILLVLEIIRQKEEKEGRSSFLTSSLFTKTLHPIVLLGTGAWLLLAAKNQVFCSDEEVNFFVTLGGIITIAIGLWQLCMKGKNTRNKSQ